MMRGDFIIKWPEGKSDFFFASNTSMVTEESLEKELGTYSDTTTDSKDLKP